MKVCPQVWFPLRAYPCLLVELVLDRPLGTAVWCNSPAVETFGSYPRAVSTPLLPICSQTKVTDGFASYCGSPAQEVLESLKVTGRSSSVGLCRMALLTHGGLFNASALLFLYHLQCDGILAGVESVPEAVLLTLCITPFYEGPIHCQTLPLFIIEHTAFLPVSADILCWLSKAPHADFETVDTFLPIFQPCEDWSCSPFGLVSAISVTK